jgi:ferredoxin-NADP reductase
LRWHTATVRDVVAETRRARTLVLDVPDWPGHRAGQHVDVRLTAEDGYQAARSYSIASAPELDALELTVELVEDGEVSPYLVGELRAGDRFEVRGPIGGHFTWDVRDGGPLLLVAGGSGLVPLMAMLRHRAARGSDVPAHVLVSVRGVEDRLYGAELDALEPRAGLAGVGAARGRRDAGRPRAGRPGAAASLRLRSHAVRRARRDDPRRRRPRPRDHPRRALRPHGRMR